MDWGSYTEGGGGEFIDTTDFLLLVKTGETVFLTGIRDGISNYNNKSQPQYLVDFTLADGTEKTKGFSKGITERDVRMERIRETLATTGEPMEARFIKVGRRNDIAGA